MKLIYKNVFNQKSTSVAALLPHDTVSTINLLQQLKNVLKDKANITITIH